MHYVILPLMLLNFFAGILGGIGMLLQGEWGLFLFGLGCTFIGVFILSFLLLPGMIFLPAVSWAAERNNVPLMFLAGVPAIAWTYLVLAVSCVVIFGTMVQGSDASISNMLWGYAAATGPWSYMAREDAKAGNDNASTTAFFAQLGVISMMVATFVNPSGTSFYRLIYWFAPFLVLGLLVQCLIAWVQNKNANREYW